MAPWFAPAATVRSTFAKPVAPLAPGLGTAYVAAVTADAPNAYYHLGEAGPPFVDYRGSGPLNLTVFQVVAPGAPALVTNYADGACKFNAAPGGFLLSVEKPVFDLGDVLTIEAWIKRNTTGGATQAIVSKQNGAYYLRILADGTLVFLASQVADIVHSTTKIADTNTHYVAVTKNGAAVHLYIDAVDVTGTVTNATLVNNTGDFRIGYDVVADAADMTIDEVAIYPVALPANRIFAHYAAGVRSP